jgi:hypothetical protein
VPVEKEPYFNGSEKRHRQFWNKVDISGDCWDWQGYISLDGYGKLGTRVGGIGIMYYAHRVAYEFANGQIPSGLVVCHRCDNRKCCNPDHLFAGTQKDNVLDMNAKSRRNDRIVIPNKVIEEIRIRRANGEFGTHLAKEYGIDASYVYKLCKGAYRK